MSYHQYPPPNAKGTQLSIEPIPYSTQINDMNGMVVNNQSVQYGPTNEQMFPKPQQIGVSHMVDTSPVAASHDMFQSPTQLTSQMNRFHLQTPTTESAPVFSNNASGATNMPMQTATPTNSIPRNYQNQYVLSHSVQNTPVAIGHANSNISPNTNTQAGPLMVNQHLVQQQFLLQQQLMAQNNHVNTFVPANPMDQKVDFQKSKKTDGEKKVHSRRPSTSATITKPTKPKKPSRSKKDSFSSLEDFKGSDTYEHDKEITIDDLLKDDPLLELTSPVALEDESNDNSLFSSFIEFDDMPQPQPSFIGLGLDFDLDLGGALNDGSANESTVKSNSSLSLSKRPSTPENDKLFELFVTPRKKMGSPSKLSSGANSPNKGGQERSLEKSNSCTAIRHSALNSSINSIPLNKNQPKFSLSECSNTFPVNSNTTNNYSFIIEKKSFSVPSHTNSKARRKSLPKMAQKSNERPVMRKMSTDASITKPSIQSPTTVHQASNSTSVSSPKVLRNMKSGMLLFQLELNNGNK